MTCSNAFLRINRPAVLSSLLAALLLAAAWLPEARAQADPEPKSPLHDAIVYVQGMACENCARWMKTKLSKFEAVERAQVLLDEQKVLLNFKEGQTVTEEALREAVENAGYKFRKVVFAAEKADASGASDAG